MVSAAERTCQAGGGEGEGEPVAVECSHLRVRFHQRPGAALDLGQGLQDFRPGTAQDFDVAPGSGHCRALRCDGLLRRRGFLHRGRPACIGSRNGWRTGCTRFVNGPVVGADPRRCQWLAPFACRLLGLRWVSGEAAEGWADPGVDATGAVVPSTGAGGGGTVGPEAGWPDPPWGIVGFGAVVWAGTGASPDAVAGEDAACGGRTGEDGGAETDAAAGTGPAGVEGAATEAARTAGPPVSAGAGAATSFPA